MVVLIVLRDVVVMLVLMVIMVVLVLMVTVKEDTMAKTFSTVETIFIVEHVDKVI